MADLLKLPESPYKTSTEARYQEQQEKSAPNVTSLTHGLPPATRVLNPVGHQDRLEALMAAVHNMSATRRRLAQVVTAGVRLVGLCTRQLPSAYSDYNQHLRQRRTASSCDVECQRLAICTSGGPTNTHVQTTAIADTPKHHTTSCNRSFFMAEPLRLEGRLR